MPCTLTVDRACRAQILEWWYTSGEEKLASQKALPPPPPPPPPRPAPDGVRLPEDASVCPLCRQARPRLGGPCSECSACGAAARRSAAGRGHIGLACDSSAWCGTRKPRQAYQ